MPVVDSPTDNDEAAIKAASDVFGGFSYVAKSVVQEWINSKDNPTERGFPAQSKNAFNNNDAI
jgi:hypothetical protein